MDHIALFVYFNFRDGVGLSVRDLVVAIVCYDNVLVVHRCGM